MNPVPERIARRRIDGVLLLDKPFGITSNAALGRVKRAFRAQKGGHTGT
ncbi:MAG TPA: tRNA pseudouridine(55) synthase TruB, partial [Casimicrobiaceae bacterium]